MLYKESVAPLAGAWIEIPGHRGHGIDFRRRPPRGGVD